MRRFTPNQTGHFFFLSKLKVLAAASVRNLEQLGHGIVENKLINTYINIQIHTQTYIQPIIE